MQECDQLRVPSVRYDQKNANGPIQIRTRVDQKASSNYKVNLPPIQYNIKIMDPSGQRCRGRPMTVGPCEGIAKSCNSGSYFSPTTSYGGCGAPRKFPKRAQNDRPCPALENPLAGCGCEGMGMAGCGGCKDNCCGSMTFDRPCSADPNDFHAEGSNCAPHPLSFLGGDPPCPPKKKKFQRPKPDNTVRGCAKKKCLDLRIYRDGEPMCASYSGHIPGDLHLFGLTSAVTTRYVKRRLCRYVPYWLIDVDGCCYDPCM